MILLFDSSCCNLGSVKAALQKLKKKFFISSKAKDLTENISAVLLPGVGSYDLYMHSLNQGGFSEKLKRLSFERSLKIFGICSGAQVLFSGSEEGSSDGLGLLNGKVKKISSFDNLKLPHIGWNKVEWISEKSASIVSDETKPFYFCHSYCFPASSGVIGETLYGNKFPVFIKNRNTYAIQFHPEKSYEQGLEILDKLL